MPGIGNWCEVVVPAVNDGVHCHWVRYRGEDVTPIGDEDERIRRYDANEKVCFAAFVSYYSELVSQDVCRDVLNPVQPECMDIYDLKDKYGEKITFWGGISTQKTLPYGTPDEVAAETCAVAAYLGQGGGFITAPTQEIQADVPFENLCALIDTAKSL